jgi:hypothetical protein
MARRRSSEDVMNTLKLQRQHANMVSRFRASMMSTSPTSPRKEASATSPTSPRRGAPSPDTGLRTPAVTNEWTPRAPPVAKPTLDDGDDDDDDSGEGGEGRYTLRTPAVTKPVLDDDDDNEMLF